jgi:chitin-binding protein
MTFSKLLPSIVLPLSLSLTWILGCESHGVIEYPASRNQFCGVITKPEDMYNPLPSTRTECFDVFAFGSSAEAAYQFMSVLSNGPGRIGDNPLPNNVCGYGSTQFKDGITPWDAYSVDWPTNDMSSGKQEFRWNILWGSHFSDTMEFRHWITRENFVYDRDRPLNWGDFEEAPFCTLSYNDATPNANPNVIPLKGEAKFRTYCDVPQRSGRHVIYAEWGRRPPSSDERFHSCIDVQFNGNGPAPTGPFLRPTPAPVVAPAPTPIQVPTGSFPSPTGSFPSPTTPAFGFCFSASNKVEVQGKEVVEKLP